METSGVAASVRSDVYGYAGNVHIFPVQTLKGLYYKVVSDSYPNKVVYVGSDNINEFDGFPPENMFVGVPILEDYSPETEKVIDELNKRQINSEASTRYSSYTRQEALSPDEIPKGYTGIRVGGPDQYGFMTKGPSILQQHSRDLDARRIFNPPKIPKKGWFWGGRKVRKTRRKQLRKKQTRKRK